MRENGVRDEAGSDWEQAVGTFVAEDPSGKRCSVLVYETPSQRTAEGRCRPILKRRFITSDGHPLKQMSSRLYRILPDGPDLTAVRGIDGSS